MDRLYPPCVTLDAGGHLRRLVGGDGRGKDEALHQVAIELTEHAHLGRQFGPLHLGTLPAGRMRELTKIERGALLTLARRDQVSDPPGEQENQ